MNRIEFYNRLDRFKEQLREKDELEHAGLDRSNDKKNTISWNNGKLVYDTGHTVSQNKNFKKRTPIAQGLSYYAKIDKYYPDGKARYFYSKDEWDAYNNAKNIEKKNEEEAKARQKFKEEQRAKNLNNAISSREAAEKAGQKTIKEENEKRASEIDNYRKNAEAAANAEADRYKKQKENILKEKTFEKTGIKNPKNSQEAEKFNSTKNQIEKEQYKNNENIQKTITTKDEIVKIKGKMNLLKNKGLDNKENKQMYNKLAKELEQKEKELKESREKFANTNTSARDAEIKKAYEKEQKRREEKLEEWKNDLKDQTSDYEKEIEKAILACATSRNTQFKVNNEMVDLLKEKIKERDPNFDGDIAKYVRPYVDSKSFGLIGDLLGLQVSDNKHISTVAKAFKEMQDDIKNEIENTSYEDANYSSYLTKLAEKKTTNKNKAISNEINNAKLAIRKIYNGDYNDNTFKLDESLMNVLNAKLEDLDGSYGGDITKYVRPYLFGKWIKDDVSYENVMKALDQLESELKTADKNSDAYGDFINKVSKILA